MTLHADVGLRRDAFNLHVALDAGDDEVVALLGPNGSGKTTLLRILAGLQRADAGRVELDGAVLEESDTHRWVPPEHRGVAMVFQDHGLFPHLSAVENVAFGLRRRGVRHGEARRRAAEWLERLDVIALAARRPAALSGGQAQRVALARALALEARLLLLDEPLASVDAAASFELRRLIRAQLAAQPGVRLLVTHDPVEAGLLADRVVIVEAGHVVQEGTMAEVAARPRSAWVARVGGLNLFRGTASAGVVRLDEGGEISVAGEARGPVLATVHPRAVSLHRTRPTGSPRNVLPATVGAVDREGDRWRVPLTGRVPLVAEVTAAAAVELRLGEGGTVFAAIKATDIDVYPS